MQRTLAMLTWIFIFQIIGYVMSGITRDNILSWYSMLIKSSLTPPPIVFGIVWTILYIAIAIAGYLLWEHRNRPRVKIALGFYAAQILMNWAWTPLFFHFHLITLAFYWIIAIAILTFITIILAKNDSKWSSYLLMPYLGWLVFAAYLNGVIMMLN